MNEVTETQLPGVGVRYEFDTADGERIGVVNHVTGRREIVIYDVDDPDMCRPLVSLDARDARILSDVLGATQVAESVGAIQHHIEGLALEWVEVGANSELTHRTLDESNLRDKTGASVVAVLRDGVTEPAPGPEFALMPGDTAVVVGTPEGLAQVRDLARG